VTGSILKPEAYLTKDGEPNCKMAVNATSLNFINVVKSTGNSNNDFDDDF